MASEQNNPKPQDHGFGLNIVFEDGGGRKGNKHVRSAAAKAGWDQRKKVKKLESDRKSALKRRKGLKATEPTAVEAHGSSSATHIGAPGPSRHEHTYIQYCENPGVDSIAFHGYPSPVPTRPAARAPSDGRPYVPHDDRFVGNYPYREDHRQGYQASKTATESAESRLLTPPATRPSSPFFQIVMNESYPVPSTIGTAANPFSAFPVKWEPFFGSLLQSYRNMTISQTQQINTGWNLQQVVNFIETPLRASVAFAEPALFFATLATTAAMMARGNMGVPSHITHYLQSQTVQHLNAAISDPRRSTSNAVILAVDLIALYETASGKHETAALVHQPALRKIAQIRGGLNAMWNGGGDGRYVVWYLAYTDRVIANMSGNKIIFDEFSDETMTGTSWDDIWPRMHRAICPPGKSATHEYRRGS